MGRGDRDHERGARSSSSSSSSRHKDKRSKRKHGSDEEGKDREDRRHRSSSSSSSSSSRSKRDRRDGGSKASKSSPVPEQPPQEDVEAAALLKKAEQVGCGNPPRPRANHHYHTAMLASAPAIRLRAYSSLLALAHTCARPRLCAGRV